jgi:hypothetical protein
VAGYPKNTATMKIKILHNNGFVSKTGQNAHIVVIPNRKAAKDMKSKKFNESL